MAVSGSGGWIPSNRVRWTGSRLCVVGGYTQNKPRHLIAEPAEAASALRRGESVTIDMRWPYRQKLLAYLSHSEGVNHV